VVRRVHGHPRGRRQALHERDGVERARGLRQQRRAEGVARERGVRSRQDLVEPLERRGRGHHERGPPREKAVERRQADDERIPRERSREERPRQRPAVVGRVEKGHANRTLRHLGEAREGGARPAPSGLRQRAARDDAALVTEAPEHDVQQRDRPLVVG